MTNQEYITSFDTWVEHSDAVLNVPEIRAAIGEPLAAEMQALNAEAFLPNISGNHVMVPARYRKSDGHAIVPQQSALGFTLTPRAVLPTPMRRENMLADLRSQNVRFPTWDLNKELLRTVRHMPDSNRRVTLSAFAQVVYVRTRTPNYQLGFIGRSFLTYGVHRFKNPDMISAATQLHELLHVRDNYVGSYTNEPRSVSEKVLAEMRGHAVGAIVLRHALVTGQATPELISDDGTLSMIVDAKREALGISVAELLSDSHNLIQKVGVIGSEQNLYKP